MNSVPIKALFGADAYGLLHTTIRKNTIRIHNSAAVYTSTIRSMGIGLYPNQRVGSKDVAIQGNTIVFDAEPDGNKLNTLDKDSAGIGIYSNPTTYAWEDIFIQDNVVRHSGYSGLLTNVTMTHWKINNNVFINCGSFPSEAFAPFRYPVRITSPAMTGVDVSGNSVIDTETVSITKVAYSFSVLGTTTDSIAVTAKNNALLITDPVHSYFVAKYQTGPHALVRLADQ